MLIETVNGSENIAAQLVRAEPSDAKIPVPNGREGPKEAKGPDLSELSNLVSDALKNLNVMHGKNLNFSVHAASGRTVITVTDEVTGQIVREIPSEEMLNLAVKLEEMMGLIFDQKA